MKKTITQNEYWQVVGLLALAHRFLAQQDELGAALQEVTGEVDDPGWCVDALYDCTVTADALLEHMNVTVEPDENIPES